MPPKKPKEITIITFGPGVTMGKNPKKMSQDDEPVKPTKEQDEIAKFLRFNCPTNSTIYQENEAHYFSGSKAVDTLLNSKYGNKSKGEPKFADRVSCTHYIQELMDLGMIFRAKKLVSKKDKEKKKDKKDSDVSASEQDEKNEEKKGDENKKEDDKDKKKKKVKLEYHPMQTFIDDKDVYVWIFDPTPLWKKLVGLGMVLITVAGCCFPLWPMWMRQGVWYLSMVGLGAFGVILVTAILRTILFGIIWLVTGGQHKLWVLPNLTEDCGFFESFQPWYTYEYCPRNATKEDDKKKKDDKKKDKDSDAEEEKPLPGIEEAADDNLNEESAGSISDDEQGSTENTGTESEGSQNSAPPSPESSNQPRKRRVRRADDGFVHVK